MDMPPPPPAGPPPSPVPADPSQPLDPTAPAEREPILDVLRGFALLGILIINIELMRAATLWTAFSPETSEPVSGADQATGFVTGWLVAGKFVSSFAILFGVGAALIARRSLERAGSPRGLLAKRYAWLIVFGLAHMVLLFPGDILFAYGVTGMILLAFVKVRPSTALAWAGGILAVALTAIVGFLLLGHAFDVSGITPEAMAEDPFLQGMADFFATRAEQAQAASTTGSYLDVVVANVWMALVVQVGQLFLLPWLLALFLIGFAAGRSGIATDPAAHVPLLRRTAAVGLLVGLPLNVALGLLGPMGATPGTYGMDIPLGMQLASGIAQVVGAPLLAIGYLSALTLLCLRRGPIRRLGAVGRMSLSGYLAQSVLALIVFAGFGLYGRLSTTAALVVVAGVWAVLLLVCPWWLTRFRFGPAEWLWRRLVYGTRQPMRRAATGT